MESSQHVSQKIAVRQFIFMAHRAARTGDRHKNGSQTVLSWSKAKNQPRVRFVLFEGVQLVSGLAICFSP
ncbi:hypothetical protein [Pseudomonas viridiflava]|uniref:hypothetical protein n=1 Tax=Pseudomonas viridiflava TaxID=33069 RepID=UPI00117B29B8|nr:hypothetical protein [Pseudomonas viridiflava]MEE4663484.1 hypothetical protein [Pseudomonas alliivorans]MEE4746501.1 hypothetical protein [Pseudomonas alliivorans]MEE5144487.1 hypothetical protein [Pseudomonas alliivorans]